MAHSWRPHPGTTGRGRYGRRRRRTGRPARRRRGQRRRTGTRRESPNAASGRPPTPTCRWRPAAVRRRAGPPATARPASWAAASAGSKPNGSSSRCAGQQVRVGEQVAGRAVGDDPPLVEDDRAGAQLQRVRQVVRDHEHGDRQRHAGSRPARGGLAGSKLDDGSSSTRISGRIASTVATATRRRCPNDRWCGARSRCSAMPTAASASSTRAAELRAAQAEVGRPERDVLGDRRHEQLVVRVLEDDADPAADLGEAARSAGSTRQPADLRPSPPAAVRGCR